MSRVALIVLIGVLIGLMSMTAPPRARESITGVSMPPPERVNGPGELRGPGSFFVENTDEVMEMHAVGSDACNAPPALPLELAAFRAEDTSGRSSCGVVVYDNQYDGSGFFISTGAGKRIADDCWLVGAERGVCQVGSEVYNGNSFATTVTLELWDGCPQGGGTRLIASAPMTVQPGLNDLMWSVGNVPVHNVVWVAWTSPSPGVGPRISRQAEVGYTDDRFGTDACGSVSTCYCWYSGNPWAGFDVTISALPIACACCLPERGCDDMFQAQCAARGGTWHAGAYCATFVCPPECAPGALFSQPPLAIESWSALVSDQDASSPFTAYDNFVGIDRPICGVQFWGIQGRWTGTQYVPCVESPQTFDITFYQDSGGQPGSLACSYTVTVPAADTGLRLLSYSGAVFPLYGYSAALEPCCTLSQGWISVVGHGAATDCVFLWIRGGGLNDGCYQRAGTGALQHITYDLAFCLSGKNHLVLEAADCQHDAFPAVPGYQIAVGLWMRHLSQNASGFQAFLTFDDAQLSYRGDLSLYSDTPFSMHVQTMATAQTGTGTLCLDGSDAGGHGGTNLDSLLATLVFDVDTECVWTTLGFDDSGPFFSELSYQGVPIATHLVGTEPTYLDNTAPTIVCGATGGDVDSSCQFILPFAATVSDGCCLVTGDVSASVALIAGGATLGPPSITKTLSPDGRTVTLNGVVLVSAVTACPARVQVTIDASDCCQNAATACVATADVSDVTPPILTCGDVHVPADAGVCTAVVSLTALASDNCATIPGSQVVFTIDDNDDGFDSGDPTRTGNGSTYTFHSGATNVRASATDNCGNTGHADFAVFVRSTNVVQLGMQLANVTATATRCIHFVTDQCSQTVDWPLTFTEGSYSGSVEIPCGSWTVLCAKDRQHTKWDTVTLTDVGTYYQAGSVVSLVGGDTDDDGDVDINDVTLFIYQFGQAAHGGGCPWDATRDADFSDNGNVNTEDYSFLTSAWLTQSNCACHSSRDDGGNGPIRVQAVALPPDVLASVDLNADGLVDYEDVELFESLHGLPHELSAAIRASASAGAAEPLEQP